jgi:dolichol-phosphate mannosyltransferase
MKERDSCAVIMPVYNEDPRSLAGLMDEWTTTLDSMGIDWYILLLDDASDDPLTRSALRRIADAGKGRIALVRNVWNMGHGPTIHVGFRMAAAKSPWVFQADSDGEIPAHFLPVMWKMRSEALLLLGRRVGRRQRHFRRLMSNSARYLLRSLYGCRVLDPNSPYRLVRSDVLLNVLATIPEGSFAPNLLMCGRAAQSGISIVEIPVEHVGRSTGAESLRGFWKLVQVSLRCAVELLSNRRSGG